MSRVGRRVLLTLVDDLDGSGATRTHTVRLDDHTVQIDLSDAHSQVLQEVLAPYLAAGRRPDPAPPRRDHSRTENQLIRCWASEHGLRVSDRGAIPRTILTAYESAHRP